MPKEFAPGIPVSRAIQDLPKIEKPRTLEFGIHHHFSEGAAKEHFDLRLGDSETGHAHSWALKYLPKPGETRLAVHQPTHTVGYMDFKGRIDGYGKGQVNLLERGKAEVLSSSSGHVRFNVYKGKDTSEYLLRRPEPESKKWTIQNITPTRESGFGKLLPTYKPKYRTTAPEKLDVENEETELQAKIDGAHTLVQFGNTGRTPRIVSYRARKGEAGGIINHTPKFPGFSDRRTPGGLKDTIVRAETYAVSQDGKVLPAARIGGILNANVWQSREKQQTEGKLEAAIIDVERFRGKDVSNLPWKEKKPILQRVAELAPWLKLPRSASTPEEKKKLLHDIARGKEPTTHEGVIEWHPDSAIPKKAKFLEERDVYVKDVFAEEGTKRRGTMAGGFEISASPRGPVIGRVGTGFSHAMKKDMLENADSYKGLKMRVLTERAPQHYAPRSPRFLSFHLDQDLPEGIKTASINGVRVNIEPHPQGIGVVVKALHIPKGERGQGRARAIIRSIKDAYPNDQIWIRPRPYGDMPVPVDVLKKFYESEGFRVVDGKDNMVFEKQAMSTNPDTVKKKIEFQGIPIHIDRPKGFVMSGKDKKGQPWTREYKYDYGFIPKTEGGDGDGIDVFLGPDQAAPNAFWAIQTKPDGSFDEYKVFLGFRTRQAATTAYKAHIPADRLSAMLVMSLDMMKAMLGLSIEGITKSASLVTVYQSSTFQE